MVLLLLSILSSTTIFVVFKLSEKLRVKTLPIITINYTVATLLGFFLANKKLQLYNILDKRWLLLGMVIGVFYIIMFFLLAKSTKTAGITPTSIAAKMSVIFPIGLSIAIEPNDTLTPIKLSGFLLAIIALFLATYRSEKKSITQQNLWLPIILFLGMGLTDSLVKYAQFAFITDDLNALFAATVFATSGLIGYTVILFKKEDRSELLLPRTLIVGAILGAANFGSAYFFIAMLNHSTRYNFLANSTLIGINNVGIVVASTIIGMFIFNEKYSRINKVGIAVSFIAIYTLTMNQ